MADKRILTNLDFGNVARIKNLPNATEAQQPVTLAQLDALAEGISWKKSARVASQANINLASPGANIDGLALTSGDRVLVRAQTAPAENGIYVWGGAAQAMVRASDADTFDSLEAAAITVEEGTSAGVTYRQTAVNGTIGTTAIAWTPFGTSAPAASETVAGILEIATQAEVDAGVDDTRALTPAKLANAAGRIRKYAATFGDTTNTSYTITHNLNTRDVQVNAYAAASPFDEVLVQIDHTTVNTVTITVAAAPGANALRAVVVG